MNISLSLLGWLNLDNKINIWDVKTSRSNISGNENLEFLLLKALKSNLSQVLGDITMKNLDVLLDFV